MLGITIAIFSLIAGCTSKTESQHLEANQSPDLITITDSLNNTLHFSGPPNRIVTLDSYSTEILIAIGVEKKIVGVGDGTKEDPLLRDYITDAQVIGTFNNPDFEKITSLKPDVIIAPGSTSDVAKTKFKKGNLKVAYFDCYYLTTIIPSVREMGKMTGKTENAERYLNFFNEYDELIVKKLQNVSIDRRPTVYYAVQGDYTTVGNGSGGNMYLEKLKVKNIARDFNVHMPKVSPEWIITENPDIIIRVVSDSNEKLSDRYHAMKLQPGFSDLNAIKNNRFYAVNTKILYGPREIIGLLYLGKIFYPEHFSDINPEYALNQYSELFIQNSNKTETVFPVIIQDRSKNPEPLPTHPNSQ